MNNRSTGDGSMEPTSPSAVQLSDLPDELLSVVRSKVNSLCGRVRFAAVCKSWRAAQSPSALPLLLLSPGDWTTDTSEATLYCPEDGGILRVPLPSRLSSMWFNGSYDGGRIATSPRPGAGTVGLSPIRIMNLFSGAQVTLSKEQRRISRPRHVGCPYVIWKIIFSEAPTSSSCILAAMISGCNIALCKIGCPDGGWTVEKSDMERLEDIVFFRGNLYGLTHYSGTLFRFDIGVSEIGAPVVTASHQLEVQRHDSPRSTSKSFSDYCAYIFELCDKLAMAVNTVWTQNGKHFFRVYELVDTSTDDCTHIYKWLEVHNLGDYALFLGPRCSSKAVHVQIGGRGGVEKNHIYYSDDHFLQDKQDEETDRKSYLTISVDGDTKYFRKCQSVGDGGDDMVRIPSVGYYVRGSPYLPMWCFPPDL